MESTNTTSPWRAALRQSRYVALGAIAIAVMYNAFATTAVPWIAEAAKSEGGTANRNDVLGGTDLPRTDTLRPDTTQSITPPETTAVAPTLDTTQSTTALDDQHRKDSIEAARREALRIADSTRKALAALKKVDTVAKKTQTPTTSTAEPGKARDINDIAIVKEAFDKKAALFIDARKEEDFAKGHIPGAINIYGEDDFQQYIPMLIKYPPTTTIIVYCGGGLCELSHDTANNIATLRRFAKLFVFTGGTKEWQEAGYPFTGADK